MELPAYLLRECTARIDECIASLLSNESREGATVEIRLGQIIASAEERRILLDAPHAVIFRQMPNEYRFRSGISKQAYARAVEHFRGPNTICTKDVLSFRGTVRKISQGGRPVYQSKRRRELFCIHLPGYVCDAQVTISTVEEVANPGQPQDFEFFRSREQLVVPGDDCSFVLTKTWDLGRRISKDRADCASKVPNFLDAGAKVGGAETGGLPDIILKLITGGFQADLGNKH